MFDTDVDSKGRGFAILTPECAAARVLVAINEQMVMRRLSDPEGKLHDIPTKEIMSWGLIGGKREFVIRDLTIMQKRLGLVVGEHRFLGSSGFGVHGFGYHTPAGSLYEHFWKVTDFGTQVADRLVAGEEEIVLEL